MSKKNLRKGFTTVELIIVIAVIAILASTLIPTFSGLIKSANKTATLNNARQVYNNWLLKNVTSTANLYIVSGEGDNTWYYPIINGKLETEEAIQAKPSGQIIKASDNADGYECTHNNTATVTGNNAEKPCGTCDATADHTHCTNCNAKIG